MNTFPTKITPCPIVESVVEITYDRNTAIEPNAVYGKVYDQLKNRYSNSENLPIFQLPEEVRLNDKNLKNRPWHKFSNENYEVLVGGSVLIVISKQEYQGWSQYKEEIDIVFKIFQNQNIFSSITRIGLKYVDLFSCPIINKINISVSSSSLSLSEVFETHVRTVLPKENELTAIVAIMNNVSIEHKNETKNDVSLLDIDVFRLFEQKDSCNYKKAIEILEEAHQYQKELFFKLVSEKFLRENGYTIEIEGNNE
jgi:uncharacterized protein (TIGR04255 family)